MILTETINFKLNQFNSHHFKRIGYDVEGKESIDVRIEDIGKGSKVKVRVKCDICGFEKDLNYQKYNKNIKSHNIYACSNKCAVVKGEKTCLEKYGTKYALQNDEIKNELKEYFVEKFGVDNPSKLQTNKDKREKTMLERFGVKTNIILPETHEKAVKLSITEESIEKRKNTLKEKYGVDNPMKSKEIYDKFRKTNLKKYGFEYPAQNQDIFVKTQISGLKIRQYHGLNYQGTYELDFLKKLEELQIIDSVSKTNSIKYFVGNQEHIYFPDYFIEKYNLIIEVKSSYYFNLSYDKNIAKREACEKLNYNFIFIIDKDYSGLMSYIENKRASI